MKLSDWLTTLLSKKQPDLALCANTDVTMVTIDDELTFPHKRNIDALLAALGSCCKFLLCRHRSIPHPMRPEVG